MSPDPRQLAYEAERVSWRALVAALQPHQHPDGSPVTPYAPDPAPARIKRHVPAITGPPPRAV